MNRVVYNSCYGGFSIGLKCYLWLKENNLLTEDEIKNCEDWINRRVEIHIPNGYKVLANSKNEFVMWVTEAMFNHYDRNVGNILDSLKESPGLLYKVIEGETAESLQLVEFTYENVLKYRDIFNNLFSFYIFNEKRHDKRLLAAIDALGIENCGGECAELAIEEIYGKRYKIEEYDGMESIHAFDDDDYYIIED